MAHYSEIEEAADPNALPERLATLSTVEGLRSIIASNPATPVEILERLSRHKDASVRQAVVGNPNTALEVLFILACEFPHEFLKNPILLLLHLSQPDFMKRIPPSTLLHLLRCNELTVYWLKQIQQMAQTFKEYGNTRSKLLEGITIRGEVSMEWQVKAEEAIKRYQTHGFDKVYIHSGLELAGWLAVPQLFCRIHRLRENSRRLLVLHQPDITSAQLGEWAQAAQTVALRIALAQHPLTPFANLSALCLDTRAHIRCAVARNPNVPAKLLRQLAYDQEEVVRQAVASSRHVFMGVLEHLAVDGRASVRRAVAHHSRTSIKLLRQLASDQNVSVRQAVAKNEHLPLADVQTLAYDASAKVRAAVASRHFLSEHLYGMLVNDPVVDVRIALAFCPHLPQKYLAILLKDQVMAVRAVMARRSLPHIEDYQLLWQDGSPKVLFSLAANPYTPSDLLKQLLHHPLPLVRAALASNPRAPLELLAQEQDARILLRLARNPSASPNLLRQLAQSEDKEVRIAVARHKNAPSDVFLEMIDSLDRVTWPGLIRNPVVSRSILEQLSVSFDAVSYEEYELIDWLKLCWHPAMAAEQQQFIFSVFREKMKKVVLAYSPLSYSNHTYSKHVYFHMNSPEHIGALGPSKLRWKFLSQPDLPLPILELFACSVLWEERYLVTQHSAVTDTLLEQLAADGHAYVRAAARLAQKQKQR